MNHIVQERKYTFNSSDGKYVFHTEEKLGKNYVLDQSKVDTIIKLYSDFDKTPFTAGEIAQRTQTPKKVIEFVVNALGINHKSIPYTDETISNIREDDAVNELLIEKRASIEQKFERADWKNTIGDAEKWRRFQYLGVSAFDNILEKWNPPKYVPVNTPPKSNGQKELIVGCSDWHYGLIASERYMYNQKEWNIDETKKSVSEYAKQLKEHIKETNKLGGKSAYKRVTLGFLGDIIHGLDGFTDKGTKLEAHPLKEDQLEGAYNSVLHFIKEILSVAPKVRVLAVPGNHSSFGDYILMKMLEIYFKDELRITFDITSKRFVTFTVGKNLFLMDHGYAPTAKNRLPAPGSGRENYVNSLFMSKPEQLVGIDRRYYLSGDQHHMESYELTNAETYMFSTLVGGCKHADTSGYKSRPRQSCLVVDDTGVKQFMHFYFD